VAAPRFRHRLDAGRTHDHTRRVDLGGGFRNLDLRALEIADLGAVVRRGAMPGDLDIIIETGLRVSERDA
jgi:hypothetical protein